MKLVERKYKRANEIVYQRKLNNGLEVHVLCDETTNVFFANMIIKFGAANLLIDDLKVIPGTAHFLEHMMFKVNGADALELFSSLGAKANAMTSYQCTVYEFSCYKNFYESLTLLFKMLDDIDIDQASVEEEKRIIAQEINMYQSNVQEQIDNILNENTYFVHPFKHDIGGKVSDIKKISVKHLEDVYHKAYVNSNRILVLGGNFDLLALDSFLDDYERERGILEDRPLLSFLEEPLKVKKKADSVRLDVEIPKLMVRIKLDPQFTSVKDEYIANILFSMLIGKSSNNYELLMEKELINDSFRFYESVFCNAFDIIIDNATENTTEYRRYITKILTKTPDSYFTDEKFSRFKKAFLGRFVFALNTFKSKVNHYADFIINGTSLFDILDLIDSIKLSDIIRLYAKVKEASKTFLLIEPKID